MTRREIERRWGMPFAEVIKNIAANGMTMGESAQIVGLSRQRFQSVVKSEGLSSAFERSYRLSAISLKHRQPAWELISALAESGATRREAAAMVGYNYSRFLKVLADNPERDPFPASNKVAGYVADAGESLSVAVKRMASQGLSINATAKQIGYACGSGLAQALRVRGIAVEFSRPVKVPKAPKPRKRRWVERGGPKGEDWRDRHQREYLQWKAKNERV